MENVEQLYEWFENHESSKLEFKHLEKKFHETRQVSALMFLASKLKDRNEDYFLHGEHDVIYIGSDFDIFEDFSEEDVQIAIAHGIGIDYDNDAGFVMYASM